MLISTYKQSFERIIQRADMVNTPFAELQGDSKEITLRREAIERYVDAASTITLCAQHQKRIIDNILTLGRLDSDFLVVEPSDVQPTSVIERALKMFDVELQKSDVELRLIIEESYTDLSVEFLRLDPSRMVQVLINLLTNVIKCTQAQAKRNTSISVGPSLNQPAKNGIKYLPRDDHRKCLTLENKWGSGKDFYLCIDVQDTGRGLQEHARELLFKRFSQASPRTHIRYCGSGLGLFISKHVAELQGGQIRVASEASIRTFSFYIHTRRSTPAAVDGIVEFVPVDIQAQIGSTALARITSNFTLPSKFEPSQIHILILEDNKSIKRSYPSNSVL